MRQEAGVALLSAVLTAAIAASLVREIQETSARVTAALLPAVISGGLALLLLAALRRYGLKAQKETKD